MGMTIDELKCIIGEYKLRIPPTVYYELLADLEDAEFVSKADYETRLKADLKAILVELQLEIEELRLDRPLMSRYGHECYGHEDKTPTEIRQECSEIIQDKINALKAEKGEEDDK